MRLRVVVPACVTLTLLASVVVAANAETTPSISLRLAPRTITYGQDQLASGTIDADPPCVSGRTVDLESHPEDSSTWAPVASTTSDDDGAYAFTISPGTNAAYRAVAEGGPLGSVVCDEITSKVLHDVVRARVSLSAGRASVAAGSCVQLAVEVDPAKSGQDVDVQRKASSGWRTVATLTLDTSSRATATQCFGWASIGRIAYRAVWSKQDDLNGAGMSPPVPIRVIKAAWMKRIDSLAGGRAVGVTVRAGGHVLYQRAGRTAFAPASNEKLLLSMALLDRFGPDLRIPTTAAAALVRGGVVKGNLWILGRGDPSTGKAEIAALAAAIARSGVRTVTGHVLGATSYFARDWFAPGWKPDFPREEVGLPTALTFRENEIGGRNVRDPERYAADALTRRLRARGVRVAGSPGLGAPRGGLTAVATMRSPRLAGLMEHMDQTSDNFFAEVLGKLLGAAASGVPGTIAKGAAAIRAFARAHGVRVSANDSSGLSYRNRVSTAGITKLLQYADTTSWGSLLRELLPSSGEGTLEDRLGGVSVHAKTGTLADISALSGWVWLQTTGTWAQFSILDRGMSSSRSKPMEDAIVRTIFRDGH